ncbi:hypothetical protein GGE06_007773 [Streptomyces sp. SFB5A]|jgi:hypothetical protein|uniref:Uncharacterized protein n=1 Tax=Streptomyces nymphaeiformis TaxID=2663842 RepID=A0A7W7U9P6_9ACTN|nr:hypothetical protein [Streptomyces nymphaeiformis]
MSLFGLHRRLRGALVGHFAVVETASPPAASRIAATCLLEDRIGSHVVNAWTRDESALRTPLPPLFATNGEGRPADEGRAPTPPGDDGADGAPGSG